MRTAVLNGPLVLGGRRYIRGDKIDLSDEECALYTARGMCEPYVTKAVQEVATSIEVVEAQPVKPVSMNIGGTYVQAHSGRTRRR